MLVWFAKWRLGPCVIELRLVEPGDSATVLRWRNDPHTVAMSVTASAVSQAEHDRWFAKQLGEPLTKLYIATVEGTEIGVCRFDRDPSTDAAEVSINLNPAMRGRGLARPLLEAAIATYCRGQAITLTATIKQSNQPSLRVFARCGFEQVRTADECAYFVKSAN